MRCAAMVRLALAASGGARPAAAAPRRALLVAAGGRVGFSRGLRAVGPLRSRLEFFSGGIGARLRSNASLAGARECWGVGGASRLGVGLHTKVDRPEGQGASGAVKADRPESPGVEADRSEVRGATFAFPSTFASSLSRDGIRSLTLLQASSFAPLVRGSDVALLAPTGTGKTLAFLAPLLAAARARTAVERAWAAGCKAERARGGRPGAKAGGEAPVYWGPIDAVLRDEAAPQGSAASERARGAGPFSEVEGAADLLTASEAELGSSPTGTGEEKRNEGGVGKRALASSSPLSSSSSSASSSAVLSSSSLSSLSPFVSSFAWSTPHVVIVTPSQDLAMQITKAARRLLDPLDRHPDCRAVLPAIGGVHVGRQIQSLKGGALGSWRAQGRRPLCVVGTPGRIAELSRQGLLTLHGTSAVVFDEADVLAGERFRADVQRICEHAGKGIEKAARKALERPRGAGPGAASSVERVVGDASRKGSVSAPAAPIPPFSRQTVLVSASLTPGKLASKAGRLVGTRPRDEREHGRRGGSGGGGDGDDDALRRLLVVRAAADGAVDIRALGGGGAGRSVASDDGETIQSSKDGGASFPPSSALAATLAAFRVASAPLPVVATPFSESAHVSASSSSSSSSPAAPPSLPPTLRHVAIAAEPRRAATAVRAALLALGASRAIVFVDSVGPAKDLEGKLETVGRGGIAVRRLTSDLRGVDRADALRWFNRGGADAAAFRLTERRGPGKAIQAVRDGIGAAGASDEANATDGILNDAGLPSEQSRDLRVLVCTDVASRGVDFERCDVVINLRVPEDDATYLHRAGRAGRAGREGLCLSLVTPNGLAKLEEHVRKLGGDAGSDDADEAAVPENPRIDDGASAGRTEATAPSVELARVGGGRMVCVRAIDFPKAVWGDKDEVSRGAEGPRRAEPRRGERDADERRPWRTGRSEERPAFRSGHPKRDGERWESRRNGDRRESRRDGERRESGRDDERWESRRFDDRRGSRRLYNRQGDERGESRPSHNRWDDEEPYDRRRSQGDARSRDADGSSSPQRSSPRALRRRAEKNEWDAMRDEVAAWERKGQE